MFTGIVEEIGTVIGVDHKKLSSSLTIAAAKILPDIHIGDSICVNGVCLTVTSFGTNHFSADIMGETLRRSSLGSLTHHSRVNLERALSLNTRLGGHIVSGHIDGTGTIRNIRNEASAHWYTISAAPSLLRYMVEKGSVTIDGISLTIAAIDSSSFQVSIIPHTACNTILPDKRCGDKVNLECDLIGKYVEKLLFNPPPADSGSDPGSKDTQSLSADFLARHGYL